jgi:3-hydroxyacyl-[acyl-carrier-protein] dehydratase
MPESTASTPVKTLDLAAIKAAIPHRYPFLLIDRVDILEEDKKAVGTKCVTNNEPFFPGHFPNHPVMPGVLIIEAMAQTAAVLMLSKPEHQGKIGYLLGVDGAKFRQPVFPGSVLKLHVETLRLGRIGKFHVEAFVGDTLAAQADLTCALVEPRS